MIAASICLFLSLSLLCAVLWAVRVSDERDDLSDTLEEARHVLRLVSTGQDELLARRAAKLLDLWSIEA